MADVPARPGHAVFPRGTDRLGRPRPRRPAGVLSRQSAKVLVMVLDSGPTARAALAELVARCKHRFEQESVLWEGAIVRPAF
jgi:hypothetical protein